MTMQYVRDTYNVPAKRGRLVHIYFKRNNRWELAYSGRIRSASHLIHVDGIGFHPRHGVVYMADDGKILLDTRDLGPKT